MIERNPDLQELCRLMCDPQILRLTFGLVGDLLAEANDVILVSTEQEATTVFSQPEQLFDFMT